LWLTPRGQDDHRCLFTTWQSGTAALPIFLSFCTQPTSLIHHFTVARLYQRWLQQLRPQLSAGEADASLLIALLDMGSNPLDRDWLPSSNFDLASGSLIAYRPHPGLSCLYGEAADRHRGCPMT
jgi:hypothetical protein